MIPFAPQKLGSVLAIGAHPDDIEIGCGGTLSQMISTNPSMHVDWIVFSGAEVRRREALAAADEWLQTVRSKRIEIFEFRDSYFPADWENIKQALHQIGRECDPDIVFTHRLEDRHQDHRVLAELTWNAFRNHSILEYEIPKYEGDAGHPNMFVPIEQEFARFKCSRLASLHASQHNKAWFSEQTFEAQLRIRGVECHSEFAEAFTARKICARF